MQKPCNFGPENSCKVAKLENPEKVYHQMMDLLYRFAENGLIHGDLNEFNTMVNEEQKLFVLDFPQMVSVYHKDAQFYFERDQKCVQVLFKRRFNFVSDRTHKLEEIPVTRRLDEDAKNARFWQEQTKEDQAAIEGYMKERGAETEDQEPYDTEEDEGMEDAGNGEGGNPDAEDEEDGDAPNIELDKEAQDLGDIEQELNMLMGHTKPELAPKVVIEAEEMSWEQLLEHREKMKELKKQAKAEKTTQAQKKAKELIEAMKTPLVPDKEPKETSDDEESSSSSSEANDYIKKAVKKNLKKKKVHKASKNHPKQQGQLLRNAL